MSGTVNVETYTWQFKPRFRRHAFGWRSQAAIQRIKEAVAEIKKVARKNPLLAADGAVTLIERLSPAIEQVDGSSGAIGTAVNHALVELVAIIVRAPADPGLRASWLERLWAAHEADEMPYIEALGDYWGDLCGSAEVASTWADRLTDVTAMALNPHSSRHGYFHGAGICLSSLYRAERYQEIVDLVSAERVIWTYKRWAVRALIAMGRKREAIVYAESCRNPWASDRDIDALCEQILLSSGLLDEAYRRYGLRAHAAGTNLATFRAVAKAYPQKQPREILADLVETTPGDEGKWFAAAKEAGLYDEALELARTSPCDPKTLTRAARDLAVERPAFAVEAGLLAIHWLSLGYGYEITGADVWAAYDYTIKAAREAGAETDVRARIRQLVGDQSDRSIMQAISRQFGF